MMISVTDIILKEEWVKYREAKENLAKMYAEADTANEMKKAAKEREEKERQKKLEIEKRKCLGKITLRKPRKKKENLSFGQMIQATIENDRTKRK